MVSLHAESRDLQVKYIFLMIFALLVFQHFGDPTDPKSDGINGVYCWGFFVWKADILLSSMVTGWIEHFILHQLWLYNLIIHME